MSCSVPLSSPSYQSESGANHNSSNYFHSINLIYENSIESRRKYSEHLPCFFGDAPSQLFDQNSAEYQQKIATNHWSYCSFLIALCIEYIRLVVPLNISKNGISLWNFDSNETIHFLHNSRNCSSEDLVASMTSRFRSVQESCGEKQINNTPQILIRSIIDCINSHKARPEEIGSNIESGSGTESTGNLLYFFFLTEELLDNIFEKQIKTQKCFNKSLISSTAAGIRILLLALSDSDDHQETIKINEQENFQVIAIKLNIKSLNCPSSDVKRAETAATASFSTSTTLQAKFHDIILNFHRLKLAFISGIPMKEDRSKNPKSNPNSQEIANRNSAKIYDIPIVIGNSPSQKFVDVQLSEENVNLFQENAKFQTYKWSGAVVSSELLLSAYNPRCFNYLEPYKRESQCLLSFLLSGRIVETLVDGDRKGIIVGQNDTMKVFEVAEENKFSASNIPFNSLDLIEAYQSCDRSVMSLIMKSHDAELCDIESSTNLEIYEKIVSLLLRANNLEIVNFKHIQLILQFFNAYFNCLLEQPGQTFSAQTSLKCMENSCIQLSSLAMHKSVAKCEQSSSKEFNFSEKSEILFEFEALQREFKSFAPTDLNKRYPSFGPLFELMNDSIRAFVVSIFSQNSQITQSSNQQNDESFSFRNIKTPPLEISYEQQDSSSLPMNTQQSSANYLSIDSSNKVNYIAGFRNDKSILELYFERNKTSERNKIRPLLGKSLYDIDKKI
ncbi:MAG: hypothetical protein MHMPM18_000493 [Marteilia pararefringens]